MGSKLGSYAIWMRVFFCFGLFGSSVGKHPFRRFVDYRFGYTSYYVVYTVKRYHMSNLRLSSDWHSMNRYCSDSLMEVENGPGRYNMLAINSEEESLFLIRMVEDYKKVHSTESFFERTLFGSATGGTFIDGTNPNFVRSKLPNFVNLQAGFCGYFGENGYSMQPCRRDSQHATFSSIIICRHRSLGLPGIENTTSPLWEDEPIMVYEQGAVLHRLDPLLLASLAAIALLAFGAV